MKDELKSYVLEAQEIVSQVKEPELRKEAFRIVLQRLMDTKFSVPAEIRDEVRSSKHDNFHNSKNLSDSTPAIHPSDSTAENIRSLFSEQWGKLRHTTAEISQALDANGVPDPKHVSTVLNRLVESRYLQRIKENGTFTYWKNPAGLNNDG
jgi:predicted transcriptional regulator